jgi:hypothetical protein
MRSRFAVFNLLAAAIGAALLVFTIRRVGWSSVVAGVSSVGWWFLAIVFLGAIRMAFRARAWMVCANPGAEELTFGHAFGAILAADAVGNLTPLGLLASEPTKILMTRARISTVTSVASVAIENAFYIASVALVLLTGTWLFFQRAEVPSALQQVAQFIVVGVVILGVVGLWAARSQPAVLSRLAPLVSRLAGKSAVPADAVREVESQIYGVLQWPIGRIGRTLGWEAAFHVAAVAEVWLVLRLLPGGEQTTLVDAFLMESAGRFVMIAFKFVPYRLGIDEAGSGAVAQVLGLNPVTGVTLALVRRLRIIFLNVFGLIRLARQ